MSLDSNIATVQDGLQQNYSQGWECDAVRVVYLITTTTKRLFCDGLTKIGSVDADDINA